MKNQLLFVLIIINLAFLSCNNKDKKDIENNSSSELDNDGNNQVDSIILDCDYTFSEAIAGIEIPQNIVNQLVLLDVRYYSMDGKIHGGQLVTNKLIADELTEVFDFILQEKIPIDKVIPVVKYGWNDKLSMEDNNSYSFCYRDIAFSKHAKGLAIDLNPRQNPLRWRKEYSYRKDVPENGTYNPEVLGTFTPDHPLVLKFKSLGFKWGRHFKRNMDDHHFQK